jgi:hypothetical protein
MKIFCSASVSCRSIDRKLSRESAVVAMSVLSNQLDDRFTSSDEECNDAETDIVSGSESDRQNMSILAAECEEQQLLKLPQEGTAYSSFEEMRQGLLEFSKSQGYGIRIGRTNQKLSKVTGDPIGKKKVVWQCDRAGVRPAFDADFQEEVNREAKAKGKRKLKIDRGSRKTDCPFAFNAVEVKIGTDQWEIRYKKDQRQHVHNHRPSDGPAAHPSHRRLRKEDRDEVDKLILNRVKTSQILGIFMERGINYLLAADIYNRRRTLYHQSLQGLSPLNALYKDYQRRGIICQPGFQMEDPNQLRFLFVAYEESLDLQGTERDLDVIIMDSTFGTNAYNMPLMHFVSKCL